MAADERRQKIYAEINARAARMAHEQEGATTKTKPPLTRRQEITAWVLAIGMLIGLLAIPYLFVWGGTLIIDRMSRIIPALGKDYGRGTNPWHILESIEVEGECSEDHVKDATLYEGTIRHMRHRTTDAQEWSGFVALSHAFRFEALERSLHDRRARYAYQPPSTIWLHDLRPEDLEGDILHLAGISESFSDGDTYRRGYDASCTLRVTRRLDHRASQPVETAQ
jgi:hypothetical protein